MHISELLKKHKEGGSYIVVHCPSDKTYDFLLQTLRGVNNLVTQDDRIKLRGAKICDRCGSISTSAEVMQLDTNDSESWIMICDGCYKNKQR